MNSSTAFLLMDMNNTSPEYWHSVCHANSDVFSLAVYVNYPDVDLSDIQFSILQDALIKGI